MSQSLSNSVTVWTTPGIEKNRDLTLSEKIRLEKEDQILTEKAETRDLKCWHYGCNGKARIWVREIQFDFKENLKDNINHAIVSSRDYTGPVPGFCYGHTHVGPIGLAEKVYFSRNEMYWGLRPNRWWVIFTDGSKTGGYCKRIDEKQEMPIIKEELIKGDL